MRTLSLVCAISVLSFASCRPQPRASIVTVACTDEQRMREFFEDVCLIDQFKDFELILVSPQSADGGVIDDYVKRYPNIKHYQAEPVIGTYALLNQGIEKATADIITLSSIDERRRPAQLAQHVEYLEKHPLIDLVYASYCITSTRHAHFEPDQHAFVVDAEDFSLSALRKRLVGPQPTWRKALHARAGYFRQDMSYWGDTELWNRAALAKAVFIRIDGISTCVYQGPTDTAFDDNRYADERAFIRGAYGTLWNGRAHEQAEVLIKVSASGLSDHFFIMLDTLYAQLTGQTPYRFLIYLDSQDLSLSAAIRERLSRYPHAELRVNKQAAINTHALLDGRAILLEISNERAPLIYGPQSSTLSNIPCQPDIDSLLSVYNAQACNHTRAQ